MTNFSITNKILIKKKIKNMILFKIVKKKCVLTLSYRMCQNCIKYLIITIYKQNLKLLHTLLFVRN